MKNPPILISVMSFFAVLAGLASLFLGLRLIGFDWFGLLGDVQRFESVGIWGWLAVGVGILWLAAGAGLWSLQSWAWTFSMVVAGLSLFEAFVWTLEYPGSVTGLASAILPLVVIVYLNSRAVKHAFGLDDPTAM